MLTLYDPGLIDNVTKTQHTTPHDPVRVHHTLQIPKYYLYAIFYRIEYTNNSDLIIRIIRIIRNTFKRLKLVQILPKKLKIHRYLIMFT